MKKNDMSWFTNFVVLEFGGGEKAVVRYWLIDWLMETLKKCVDVVFFFFCFPLRVSKKFLLFLLFCFDQKAFSYFFSRVSFELNQITQASFLGLVGSHCSVQSEFTHSRAGSPRGIVTTENIFRVITTMTCPPMQVQWYEMETSAFLFSAMQFHFTTPTALFFSSICAGVDFTCQAVSGRRNIQVNVNRMIGPCQTDPPRSTPNQVEQHWLQSWPLMPWSNNQDLWKAEEAHTKKKNTNPQHTKVCMWSFISHSITIFTQTPACHLPPHTTVHSHFFTLPHTHSINLSTALLFSPHTQFTQPIAFSKQAHNLYKTAQKAQKAQKAKKLKNPNRQTKKSKKQKANQQKTKWESL